MEATKLLKQLSKKSDQLEREKNKLDIKNPKWYKLHTRIKDIRNGTAQLHRMINSEYPYN